MKAFLKKLLEKWKAVAARIAVVQTTIILFVLYFGVFSILSILCFLGRQDLLDKRRPLGPSFWREKEPVSSQRNQYRHQF